ncbi:putative reverse transcriptase domain-containing protein [Tanacetum coccineum]
MCRKCNQEGHIAKYYMDKVANDISRKTCFECESLNHLRTNCLRNNGNQPHGRDFVITANEAQQDPNVMTGTFSLNNHFATVLFDFGADYSFISTKLLPLINAKPSAINPEYEIEIDNGLKIETNKIVHGCRLELEDPAFKLKDSGSSRRASGRKTETIEDYETRQAEPRRHPRCM